MGAVLQAPCHARFESAKVRSSKYRGAGADWSYEIPGLWLSRLVLLVMTVGVPLLFAANIVGDGSCGIAVFFMAMVMAGLVYSLMRWATHGRGALAARTGLQTEHV